MAFLHQFLPSIFLSIFIIYGCYSSNSTPLSFSCGNGLEFQYPFWQRSHNNSENYGYPSLGISCIDKAPNIQLDNRSYHVKSVRNSEKTFLVSFYESNDTICPLASHDIRMNNSFLTYSNNVKMIHFFYNCTVYPSGVEPIKCLQIGAKHTYVFLEGSVPDFDWRGYCESLVMIPVMNKSINDGSLATSFGKALNDGFELKWSPNRDCGLCEASGGFCEFDDNNIEKFSCSCGQGRGYAHCHDQGLVKTCEFKIGLLSIGLIICCFTIAGLVFYIVRKRRNGMYKKGFNPLRTGGR